MIQITIVDNGLFTAFNNMVNDLSPITNALLRAGEMLRAEQALYPVHVSRSQPFKTDASRRWFFWALKTGLIQVPYVRTNALARSWEVSLVSATSVAVGTAHAQAPLMKGDRQATYHRVTGWETAAATTQRIEPRLFATIDAGIAQWIN